MEKNIDSYPIDNFDQLEEGLIYDVEGGAILYRFNDELSLHRAKKKWNEILTSCFLLEDQRDYEIWATAIVEDSYFLLSCMFHSACGRYAFWRLVNQQVPEIEEKLSGDAPIYQCGVSESDAHGEHWNEDEFVKNIPWLFNLDNQVKDTERNKSLVKKILEMFSSRES